MSEDRRKNSPLAFLFVTVFVDMIGYGIVVPLLPFYAREIVPGAVLVGALGSLYAAAQFFGGPYLGGLSDRVGRRPVLIVCLLGASGAYLLLGMASSLSVLVVAVTLAGLAAGTQATAQAYIADITKPEDRAGKLGMIGAAFGLGLMAGPALGGILSLAAPAAPAFAASVLALGNAAFGYLVLPESLPKNLRSAAVSKPGTLSRLRDVLLIPGIRPLLFTVFLLNLSFAGLLTNFPLFSNARFGWDAAGNAFFFAFVGFCAVLTQGALIGRLQPRFGEARLLKGGLTLMALCLALVAIIPHGALLYPAVGLLAAGVGLSIPAVSALISRRAGTLEQGTIMGGTQAVISLTLILGPVMSGLAFDGIGVGAPYWIGSLIAALALLSATAALLPAPNTRETTGSIRSKEAQSTESGG